MKQAKKQKLDETNSICYLSYRNKYRVLKEGVCYYFDTYDEALKFYKGVESE